MFSWIRIHILVSIRTRFFWDDIYCFFYFSQSYKNNNNNFIFQFSGDCDLSNRMEKLTYNIIFASWGVWFENTITMSKKYHKGEKNKQIILAILIYYSFKKNKNRFLHWYLASTFQLSSHQIWCWHFWRM